MKGGDAGKAKPSSIASPAGYASIQLTGNVPVPPIHSSPKGSAGGCGPPDFSGGAVQHLGLPGEDLAHQPPGVGRAGGQRPEEAFGAGQLGGGAGVALEAPQA